MPLFLTTLREGSECHSVEQASDGFLIVPVPGREEAFNDLARRVINGANGDYAAFPRLDGHVGYDGVHIIPIA